MPIVCEVADVPKAPRRALFSVPGSIDCGLTSDVVMAAAPDGVTLGVALVVGLGVGVTPGVVLGFGDGVTPGVVVGVRVVPGVTGTMPVVIPL